MNILITSAGRRVSLTRAFQNELKMVYSDSMVFASDSEPLVSAACQIADGYFKVPRLDQSDYLKTLLQICLENEIKLIIPTIDTELTLLADAVSQFRENGIEIVVSNLDFVLKCRDKRSIHNFFKENGIVVAKEYAKDNYKLPLFIKPTDGSRSADTFHITEQRKITETHLTNNKYMFLEYIDHNDFDEFTCDMYYSRSHKLKCVVPRQRLEVRDGEVYKAVTKKNALVDYIKARLNHIDGALGCLTTQFFVHKNDPSNIIGIEINPRFGGGYPLSYLAKANFPKWIIQEYMLNQIIECKFDVWEKDLLMIRYDDEILVHGYKGR